MAKTLNLIICLIALCSSLRVDGHTGHCCSMGPKGYVADWRDHMFVHEYGHYIQSQYMGISFLPVVGVPSLLSAWCTSGWSGMKHNERWFERWAKKLGGDYFDKKYGSKAPGYKENNGDYFNKDAFVSGKGTLYKNSRDIYGNNVPRPTSVNKFVFWDIIL